MVRLSRLPDGPKCHHCSRNEGSLGALVRDDWAPYAMMGLTKTCMVPGGGAPR